jgi:hypothetical protein
VRTFFWVGTLSILGGAFAIFASHPRNIVPVRPAHAALNPPLPAAGGGYGIALVNITENMKCVVLESGTAIAIQVVPPTDIDRQVAIITPRKNWRYINGLEYAVLQRRPVNWLIYPEMRVFDSWAEPHRSQGKPRSLYDGDGDYQILLSDSLEIDWGDIDEQASCTFRMWKK